LVGAWTLVSTKYKFPDGKTVDTFGPNPRGTLILDASGRMALINMRTSLPKFAANDRTKGTPEENKAIVEGNFVVFGTYTVNESDHTLITHSHRFDLLLESRLRQRTRQHSRASGILFSQAHLHALVGQARFQILRRQHD